MKKLLFTLIIITFAINAQHNHNHDHSGHSHGDSNYELGVSFGIANLIEEDVNAPSAHIHLSRKLAESGLLNRISLGAGFEYIFSEHTHYSIVAGFSVNPYSHFKVDIAPGILITEHEDEKEKQFVMHFELTYEFEFKGIGLGPVIGYGLAKEDNHFMAGFHIGIGL